MKKLEKGMYLKTKQELTIYDPTNFAPIDVKIGTFVEVEHSGVAISYTEGAPLISIVVVKINNISVTWTGEQLTKFNEIFEIA